MRFVITALITALLVCGFAAWQYHGIVEAPVVARSANDTIETKKVEVSQVVDAKAYTKSDTLVSYVRDDASLTSLPQFQRLTDLRLKSALQEVGISETDLAPVDSLYYSEFDLDGDSIPELFLYRDTPTTNQIFCGSAGCPVYIVKIERDKTFKATLLTELEKSPFINKVQIAPTITNGYRDVVSGVDPRFDTYSLSKFNGTEYVLDARYQYAIPEVQYKFEDLKKIQILFETNSDTLAAVKEKDGRTSEIDLNNDGKTEIFFKSENTLYCGTQGCATTLYSRNASGTLQKLFSTVAHSVYLLPIQTNGYSDLATAGGGLVNGASVYSIWKFTGETYEHSSTHSFKK